MVILRMLEREGLHDHVVVVTRWFGGKHLGGDRFRHVQDAVRIFIPETATFVSDWSELGCGMFDTATNTCVQLTSNY